MLEPTEQIGSKLRTARESAGLAVDDVVFRTQLPKSVVNALEAEDFAVFASPVYAKSFLAQYSEYLNVDAQAWLDALEPGAFAAGGLLNPLVDAPAAGNVPEPPRNEASGGWLAVIGLFALTVALVYGVMAGFEFFESRFAREPAAEASTEPRQASPETRRNPEPPKPAAQAEDEELGKPPPRAIIVR